MIVLNLKGQEKRKAEEPQEKALFMPTLEGDEKVLPMPLLEKNYLCNYQANNTRGIGTKRQWVKNTNFKQTNNQTSSIISTNKSYK